MGAAQTGGAGARLNLSENNLFERFGLGDRTLFMHK